MLAYSPHINLKNVLFLCIQRSSSHLYVIFSSHFPWPKAKIYKGLFIVTWNSFHRWWCCLSSKHLAPCNCVMLRVKNNQHIQDLVLYVISFTEAVWGSLKSSVFPYSKSHPQLQIIWLINVLQWDYCLPQNTCGLQI